ncbi:transporter [Burkholderia ubonensis]|uniref:BON domain-containing protein n=1 Tax=Burkholderia ubonensis TaxID=101571 RepID=UPI0007569A56|nr:BON domain-containing protein [Burkholderia ubonensis]KUZ67558.1 transporter [Burkholderia ubonensis]
MKKFPLQACSQRPHRTRATRVAMAVAIATATVCAVVPPDGIAAGGGGDSAASSSHSTAGSKLSDATITTKAKAELVGTSGLSAGDIHVKTRHSTVTLTGSVPDEQQRTQAVSVVKQVDGVKDVRDQLTIRPK